MCRSPRSGGRIAAAAVLALALAGFAGVALAQDFGTDEQPPAPAAPSELKAPEALPDIAKEGISLVSQLIRTVAFLGGICALGWLAVKVLGPRLSPVGGKETDLIRVVEMKRLDAKTTLYVVEVAGKHALISVSEAEVRSLSALDMDDEAIRARAENKKDGSRTQKMNSSRFAKVLARAANKEG